MSRVYVIQGGENQRLSIVPCDLAFYEQLGPTSNETISLRMIFVSRNAR